MDKRPTIPRCSFCNRTEFDVPHLLTGGGVNICSECAGKFSDRITAETRGLIPVSDTLIGVSSARCSFCGKPASECNALIAATHDRICDECIDLVTLIFRNSDWHSATRRRQTSRTWAILHIDPKKSDAFAETWRYMLAAAFIMDRGDEVRYIDWRRTAACEWWLLIADQNPDAVIGPSVLTVIDHMHAEGVLTRKSNWYRLYGDVYETTPGDGVPGMP